MGSDKQRQLNRKNVNIVSENIYLIYIYNIGKISKMIYIIWINLATTNQDKSIL